MDNWGTPDWLMDVFSDWFDPCPFNPNPTIDGLTLEWKDKTYVNPPYSSPLKWVEKAIEENKKGKTITMLLKVDTSTKWYAKLVEANAHIFFLHGRLKFKGENYKIGSGKLSPANFPSMIVILSKKDVVAENTKSELNSQLSDTKDSYSLNNVPSKDKIVGCQGISQDVKTSEGSLAGQGATRQAHNLEKRQQPSSDTQIQNEINKDYEEQ